MTSHPFRADRQPSVCAVVTDGEPCGLTPKQHAQIATEAEWRARRLLAALRQWNSAEPPPPGAYEPTGEQLEAALWLGLTAGRVWSGRSAA